MPMVTTLAELETEIGQLLGAAARGNLTNRLTPTSLREATAEFRREIDADQLAHGGSPDDPDWNLVMSDADPSEPAVFVSTIFRQETVTVTAGRAPRIAVICSFALSRRYSRLKYPLTFEKPCAHDSKQFGRRTPLRGAG